MTAAWFGLFYIVFYLTDTLANVPYFALGPEITESYSERSKAPLHDKRIIRGRCDSDAMR